MKALDNFYLNQHEPNKSCLLALRDIIVNYSDELQPVYKYRLPCFMLGKKIFCYLWIDKKSAFPYIGIGNGVKINHPDLIQGDRTFVKLFMVNPKKDIPIETVHEIFDMAMKLYD